MAMPDIGLGPPPPVDVSAQMRPTGNTSSGGPPDLAALIAALSGGSPPVLGPDITPKVLDAEPLLAQIARQVPALGPDVDRLNTELKAHMVGLPNQLAQMAAGSPLANPAPAGSPPGGPQAGPMGPGVPGVSGAGAPSGPAPAGPPPAPTGGPAAPVSPAGAVPNAGAAAPPSAPPNPSQTMGAMDTAMQLEIKLPAIGKDDPTLMPYIQGFIARMRQEVPKVVQGETEAVSPPTQAAPTDSMLSKIPVAF